VRIKTYQSLVPILITAKEKWDKTTDLPDFLIYLGYPKIDEKRIEEIANSILDGLQLHNIKTLTDLGCGLCTYDVYWSKRIRQIIAIDFSRKMLKMAKKRLAQMKIQNIDLIMGSVTKIPLKEQISGASLSLGTMKYLERSTWQALNEMVRITKKGGKVYVNGLPNIFHPDNWVQKFKTAMCKLIGRFTVGDDYSYVPWHIEDYLKRIGIENLFFYGHGWKFPATSFFFSIFPKRTKRHFNRLFRFPGAAFSSKTISNGAHTLQLLRFLCIEFECIK